MADTPLVDAAAEAPTGAGVYFFLDSDRRLLYVGKAVNLRRRLQQHAKEPAPHERSKYARVRFVAWEELAGDGRWTYLVVDGDRFTLVGGERPRTGDVFGCFPHLGKGQSSRPGIACSDGYTALLRLLWATGDAAPRPYPRSISGPSPPLDVTVPVGAGRLAALRRFLSGTGVRLLDDLGGCLDAVDPYLRPALTRDLVLARAFYEHGPVALRRLRRRHGLPSGPVTREQIQSLLHAEVTASIGDLVIGGTNERARR